MKYIKASDIEKYELLYEKTRTAILALQLSEDEYTIVTTGAGNKMMTKKERVFYEKEKFVKSIHITGEGVMRLIKEPVAGAKGWQKYWSTVMPDKSRLTATSYEGLIEKLYTVYAEDGYILDYTVDAIWKKALKNYEEEKLRPLKTIQEQDKVYQRFVNKQLAAMDIRTITEEFMKRYIRSLLMNAARSNKPIKHRAFTNMKSMFNILFRYAVHRNLLTKNPAEAATANLYEDLIDYSVRCRSRGDIMHTTEEFTMIFNEAARLASKHKGYYYFDTMLRVQDILGVRPGELCALKWKYYEVDSQVLRVCEQQRMVPANKETEEPKHYITVPFTKNEKGISKGGRWLPVSNELANLFARMKELQTQYEIKSEYIFCDSNGEAVKKDAYTDYLGNICRRLEIDRHGTYTFRRDANCRYAHSGIDVVDRGKLLGNTLGVNTSCYTFEGEEYIKRAREVLNKTTTYWGA